MSLWRLIKDWWTCMSRVANADSYQVGAGHLAAIYQATVTLTNAQIKALPTTGIVLVAAPGSGKVIQPLLVTLFAKTTDGAYTGIDANASLSVVAGALFPMTYVPNDVLITTGSATRLSDLLGGANNRRTHLFPFSDTEGVDLWGQVASVVASADGVNAALHIYIDNALDLGGGHANNTLTAIVDYKIVDVP